MNPLYDETSAGAVVFRITPEGPRYLLLQYGWGHWDFPKGHMEKGETEEQTVLRELEEETGITEIRLIENFREIIEYTYQRRRTPGATKSTKVVYFYLVETHTETIRLSHEHKAFAWLPIDEAVRHTTYDNSRNLLMKADQAINALSISR